MISGIFEIAVIVVVATILGLLGRVLRQPTILAYIFTGILVSAFGFFSIQDSEIFKIFSELGIMLLLFLIGLEINYTSLKSVGRTALIIGVGQIAFTSLFGFAIGRVLGFTPLTALYIAVALTFSSTVIIVKLLAEKKDLSSLYGKISIGFLLVQDFVAVLILLFLGSLGQRAVLAPSNILFLVLKGIVLIAVMLWLGRKVLPRLFDWVAKSSELLFLSSLAWCFLVVFLVKEAGFSIEIGGFLAGLALANSVEHFQISSSLRSLRDFFILIFFAILGASFSFSDLSTLGWPLILFSIFVLIGNPLIVLILMGVMRYKRRTGFLCGVTVAQISEFSLILVAMGLKLGHINQSAVSLIAGVGIITITLSSYLIIYADQIFKFLDPALKVFERSNASEQDLSTDLDRPIILIGYHRTGESIAHTLLPQDLLVVDFDPDVIKKLRQKNLSYIFGDIADVEIFEHLNLEKAKVLISTSPDLDANLTLLERLRIPKEKNKTLRVIVTAADQSDLETLYRYGADYVLLPHVTSGKFLGQILASDSPFDTLLKMKNHDLKFSVE